MNVDPEYHWSWKFFLRRSSVGVFCEFSALNLLEANIDMFASNKFSAENVSAIAASNSSATWGSQLFKVILSLDRDSESWGCSTATLSWQWAIDNPLKRCE